MRINFKATTNSDKCYLNEIVLFTKNDDEIVLDCEEKSCSAPDENGNTTITFNTPYIWDGEGQEYDGQAILDYIDNSISFIADIEDDAPEGYELKVKELSFIDSNGVGHFLPCYDKADCYAEYLEADSYTIYQLRKEAEDRRYLSFASLEELKKMDLDVKRENYYGVFTGVLKGMSLEDIFYKFNENRPAYFKGHSLSVSDVVVIRKKDGKETAYYCDSFGFTEVPQFLEGRCA